MCRFVSHGGPGGLRSDRAPYRCDHIGRLLADAVVGFGEHVEQREFVSWFRQTFKGVLIAAIPNGGGRPPQVALAMKLEGVLRGMPDLYVMKWHLWIEMKKIGGDVEKHQKEMTLVNDNIESSLESTQTTPVDGDSFSFVFVTSTLIPDMSYTANFTGLSAGVFFTLLFIIIYVVAVRKLRDVFFAMQ